MSQPPDVAGQDSVAQSPLNSREVALTVNDRRSDKQLPVGLDDVPAGLLIFPHPPCPINGQSPWQQSSRATTVYGD